MQNQSDFGEENSSDNGQSHGLSQSSYVPKAQCPHPSGGGDNACVTGRVLQALHEVCECLVQCVAQRKQSPNTVQIRWSDSIQCLVCCHRIVITTCVCQQTWYCGRILTRFSPEHRPLGSSAPYCVGSTYQSKTLDARTQEWTDSQRPAC